MQSMRTVAVVGFSGALLAWGCVMSPSTCPVPDPSPSPSIAASVPPQSPQLTIRPAAAFANILAPREGRRGQAVPVILQIEALDGCDFAGSTDVMVDDQNRAVTFQSNVNRREGTPCTAMIHYPKIAADFTPQAVGTYKLKLKLMPSCCAGSYVHLKPFATDQQLAETGKAFDLVFEVEVRN